MTKKSGQGIKEQRGGPCSSEADEVNRVLIAVHRLGVLRLAGRSLMYSGRSPRCRGERRKIYAQGAKYCIASELLVIFCIRWTPLYFGSNFVSSKELRSIPRK